MLLSKIKKSLSVILSLSLLFSVSASAADISNQLENNAVTQQMEVIRNEIPT